MGVYRDLLIRDIFVVGVENVSSNLTAPIFCDQIPNGNLDKAEQGLTHC